MRAALLLIGIASLMAGAGCATAPKGTYSFVVIGDNRSEEPVVQPQAYRDCITQINSLRPRPDFVMIVGDLILGYVEDRDLILREWEEFDRVTATIQQPVYLVPGNHDIWDEQSHSIFTERYGPTYYSFDHAGDHFVVLCTEEMGHAPHVAGEQLQWLSSDLERHKEADHTFVFLHRPLWASDSAAWGEIMQPLLAKYGVEVVYAGHDHEYVNYGVQDGVQYYVTGGGGAGLISAGFHHFMVTTVARDEVASVVVDTEGTVLADDVVTRLLAW